MHTIEYNGWRMHFNSDMSGDVKLTAPDGVELDEFPGELVRIFVRRYVNGGLRDELKDLIYRMNSHWGGLEDPRYYAMIVENIDNLRPADGPGGRPNENVLAGTTYFFGTPMHFHAIRVFADQHGTWQTVDPEALHDLEQLERIVHADGPFQPTELPGYEGDWILYTVPHTR